MNNSDSSTPRPVGLAGASALVAASMIGAGIFTTSGFTLAALQSPHRAMLAWGVASLIAICGAICYASLARRFSESGGEYLFLARTVHPVAGFMAGCVSLLAGFTGATAFAAKTLESYLLPFLGEGSPLPGGTLAVTAIVIATAFHLFRVEPGTHAQTALVGLKLIAIAAFLFFAASWYPERWYSAENPPAAAASAFQWHTFGMQLMWISLSFSGFNAAVYIAGEVRSPRRNVPRAIMLGTLLVAAAYLLLNAVFYYAIDPAAITGEMQVAAIAAAELGGRRIELLVSAVIVVSLFTSVSAMVMSGPRVYAQMAADGVFPSWFLFRGRTPAVAIMVQAVLAAIAVLISRFEDLLSYLSFSLSVSAALTAASLFVIAYREGRQAIDMPLFPVPVIFFVGGTLLAAGFSFTLAPLQCTLGALTILGGGVVFAVQQGYLSER